jgi:hypothetical protein
VRIREAAGKGVESDEEPSRVDDLTS